MNYKKIQESIINKLSKLSQDKGILGIFIFGSAARGEFGKNSDIDVKVLVRKSECAHVSHPYIDGIKTDMTFMSYKQMDELFEKQVKKRERIPMIAESLIIFDKTGKLQELKERYLKAKPLKYIPSDYQGAIFLAQHFTNCIERNLKDDPISALLGMHINLSNILEIRYRTLGKWQVGSKRLFKDIKSWDRPLANLLTKYLNESDIMNKFKLWISMRDYILRPLGGIKDIKELNCDCSSCKAFLDKVNNVSILV